MMRSGTAARMPSHPALPKICVSIGASSPADVEGIALGACRRGESFLELRLDLLADASDGPAIIRRLRSSHPGVLVIATCRRMENGGRFPGSPHRQLAVLEAAVGAGARLVDIEIETLERVPGALRPFRRSATTVASFHDFRSTPDLAPVLGRLEGTGADICKVATAVRRPSDNLRLLALCEGRRNVVVTGMGEGGSPARLVSPARGGLFSYVAPDSQGQGASGQAGQPRPTAPGQVTAAAARNLFRIHRHSEESSVYAVIAKPVGHSKSPLIHNSAFRATGHDGIYVPLLVEPDAVADFFDLARGLPLAGASVTIPHKQSVIPHLDRIVPAARDIGAVNTIYWEKGQLVGANTDEAGIRRPLARRATVRGSRVLVVGNGGAAKAAVVALDLAGARVVVTGRNPRRVRNLAEAHGVGSMDFRHVRREHFDILVQATPVGMTPDISGSLFPRRIPADLVFDLVYNPLETVLLRDARSQGKTVISGIEMFIEQAAEQFRTWTGKEPPLDVMRSAVLQPDAEARH